MKKIILLGTLILMTIVACKKNQLGGKSTIEGDVKHHTKLIANATVFIKFNSKESPGTDTTLYDSKVRADQNGHYSIKVYKGDYFLYGFGYDFALPAPYHVTGGTPVHIRNRETVTIDVAVTE